MDPITTLGLLGSLSSIIGLSLDLLKRGRIPTDAVRDIVARSDADAAKLAQSNSARQAINRISEDIREVIERRISRRRTEILEDLEDENLTPRQQRSQIEAGKADICRMLDYVKQFNEGKLPDEFQELWIQMGCS